MGRRMPGRVMSRRFDRLLYFSFEFVDALAYFALVRAGRGFQPLIVELREDAVFAGDPAIAECLPVVLGAYCCRLLLQRGQKFAYGAVESGGREVG
jgi:hypothetical protein